MTFLRKDEVVNLQPLPIINSSRVVTNAELGVALVLVIAGGIPFVLFWRYLANQPFNQQEFALFIMLGIYAFSVVETFAIFLLWGFQRLTLPPAFVHWLGAATVGEVAGLLGFAMKYIFHL